MVPTPNTWPGFASEIGCSIVRLDSSFHFASRDPQPETELFRIDLSICRDIFSGVQ
jgi:hypothetical protein